MLPGHLDENDLTNVSQAWLGVLSYTIDGFCVREAKSGRGGRRTKQITIMEASASDPLRMTGRGPESGFVSVHYCQAN